MSQLTKSNGLVKVAAITVVAVTARVLTPSVESLEPDWVKALQYKVGTRRDYQPSVDLWPDDLSQQNARYAVKQSLRAWYESLFAWTRVGSSP